MEELSLTEAESRYFNDLFLCCDVENTGKIPMLKATELYRSANLSNEVIREITTIAGIPTTAFFITRVQFYSCLKLIAAHQASLPLRLELISSSVQLPLPRFSWKEASTCADTSPIADATSLAQQTNGLNTISSPQTDRRNSLPRSADWTEKSPPQSQRNLSTLQQYQQHLNNQEQESFVNSDVLSTDSEKEQIETSSRSGFGEGPSSSNREKRHHRGSPEAWSTNSDSPTPTNSVVERSWAKENLWHGLLGDEHRQLLGTEEESSDRHSSDDDNETDLESVYQITPEQREYYCKQFKAVQHDTNGLLSGQVARVFFEKSRIPIEELRHIWQLCDVTRDGALSLAEFTAAMHLVVLRRNNISLPVVLPPCLHPSVMQQSIAPQEPAEADLLHLNDDDDEITADNTVIGPGTSVVQMANEKSMNMSTISSSSQASTNSHQGNITARNSMTPPLPSTVDKNSSESNSPSVDPTLTPPNASSAVAKLKDCHLWTTDPPPTQWTKFSESPTSNLSSPGPKPVNFDMQRTAQAVVSDPQILHPVPLRVTPVAGVTNVTEKQNNEVCENLHQVESVKQPLHSAVGNANISGNVAAPLMIPVPIVSNAALQHHRDSQNSDLRAIQRPQAKKIPAKNIGAIPPPPQREASIGSVGSSTAINSVTSGVTGVGSSSNGSCGADESDLPNVSIQQQTFAPHKKDPPPLPPPRPHRHGRSSSLDLNKLKMNAPGNQQSEVIAQASFDLQMPSFADFTHFPEGDAGGESNKQHQRYHASTASHPSRFSLQSNQRVSAFEVYRKPYTPRNSQSPHSTQQVNIETNDNINHQHLQQMQSDVPIPFGAAGAAAIAQNPQLSNMEQYEKRVNAISDTFKYMSFKRDTSMPEVLRHLREQNSLLLHLCNDLADELLTVKTRKEEMRFKLESIMPSDPSAVASDNSAFTATVVSRAGSSISAPVTANVTGGSGSSGIHSNV